MLLQFLILPEAYNNSMKIKSVIKKYLIVFITLCIAVGIASSLALNNSAAQQTVKQYGGNPRTIAHDFLYMEKIFGPPDEFELYLNSLINKAVKAVPVKSFYTTDDAVVTLKAIDGLLKSEGFTFKSNFLLSTGIKTKKIDCDNYSALYTAIAEVLTIPLVPVYAPNHSFIRFYFDDGSYLNWEPTEGAPRQDSFYIKKLKIAETSIKQGVYLKSLNRKEYIGVQCNTIGAALIMQKKYKESVVFLTKSIQLYPVFSSAYHNRGTAMYAMKMLKEALKDLQKASELDPNRANTHNTLGDIYFDLKEHGKALQEYQKSIECDPGNYIPYHNIAVLMKGTGREAESKEWQDKAKKIKGEGKK